ncbi:MAG TPA: hypothetical protein VFI71_13255, partial [Pyrinomonadaceae bacterium]|nr:hypothetical protein [Pyrinomonadaceae bacterium]
MDRVRAILGFQWRAYWRRFRGAGSIKASNIGVLLPLGGLALVRYLQQLPLVSNQLAKGETARYQTLLLAVFLTWTFAIMAESKRSITSRGLLHLPLTTHELFLIRLGSVFCSPIVWIVAGGSFVLVYPVTAAVNPVAGVIALLLFLLLGLLTGLTLTHLLNSKLARRLSVAVVLLA